MFGCNRSDHADSLWEHTLASVRLASFIRQFATSLSDRAAICDGASERKTSVISSGST